MKSLLTLLLTAACALGQATGDLYYQTKAATGYTPLYLTPVNGSVLFWNGTTLGTQTLGTAAYTDVSAYATAAQGALADTALQPGGDGSQLTGITPGQIGLGNVEDTALSTWTGSSSLTTGAGGLFGSLAYQSGTVSGTNTGDQTSIVGITGTLAQFNTALTSADFVSLAGTETLTNKTLTSPTFTAPVLGTPASGNFSTGTFTWPTFNQNTTGSAATLTTARTINGTSFNGSANITVTAAAGTLTGGTLASGVTASSLTSLGTLTSLTTSGVVSLGAASFPNVLLNMAGTLSNAGNVYGIYQGSLTLSPASGAFSCFQYFGGTTFTGGNTIGTAYGAYIAPLAKSGGGTITTTYGIYQQGGSGGTNNYGAYFADAVGIGGSGAASPTAKLDIDSDILRLRTAKTPASASATGNTGDHCWDANYLYICVGTNTWKRVAIATW